MAVVALIRPSRHHSEDAGQCDLVTQEMESSLGDSPSAR